MHAERAAGRSHYPLYKLIRLNFDLITGFSLAPLQLFPMFGMLVSALAIATLIRPRKIRATGMVLSECSSAAILIFAACERRFCTPRSVFLSHRVKWLSEKDMRREEAINWAQHFQWLESEIDRWQASLFGQGGDQVGEWIEQGRFVIGTELADVGLAEIIDP